MRNLMRLQMKRMVRQKAVWIYLLVMLFLTISDAMRLVQNPYSDWAKLYGGARFPMVTLQYQAVILGPLFFALIVSVSINGDKTSGMFRQPLLNGITKMELIGVKVISNVMIMAGCVLAVQILNFIVGYIFFGDKVFDMFFYCIFRILLVLIPLAVSCIGFTLLALYTANIAVTMCASLIILLADNLFSQFFGGTVSKFSYLYYAYSYSEYNAHLIEDWMIPKGILLSLIAGIIFTVLAVRRIKYMQL